MEHKLAILEKINKNKVNPETVQEIKLTRDEINQELQTCLQTKLLFLKQSYYETDPKSTKLLAYRLKNNRRKELITKLENQQLNKLLVQIKK